MASEARKGVTTNVVLMEENMVLQRSILFDLVDIVFCDIPSIMKMQMYNSSDHIAHANVERCSRSQKDYIRHEPY